MSTNNVSEQVGLISRLMRERWDKLGFFESEMGGFATGHTPQIAPDAYLCRCYSGLSKEGLVHAEEESGRYVPEPYKDFLTAFNGANVMGICLLGTTGAVNQRNSDDPIGQPISIRYQNERYLRPEYIPNGHFGIGSMNGDWYSQGHLYLTSSGEVELFHRDYDLIGARWPSLSNFLKTEVNRQMTRYRDDGTEIDQVPRLPGDTNDWERLAKHAKEGMKNNNGLLDRLRRYFSSR